MFYTALLTVLPCWQIYVFSTALMCTGQLTFNTLYSTASLIVMSCLVYCLAYYTLSSILLHCVLNWFVDNLVYVFFSTYTHVVLPCEHFSILLCIVSFTLLLLLALYCLVICNTIYWLQYSLVRCVLYCIFCTALSPLLYHVL